jgi:hypothetical protein
MALDSIGLTQIQAPTGARFKADYLLAAVQLTAFGLGDNMLDLPILHVLIIALIGVLYVLKINRIF